MAQWRFFASHQLPITFPERHLGCPVLDKAAQELVTHSYSADSEGQLHWPVIEALC